MKALNWAAVGATATAIVVLSYLPCDIVSIGDHDKNSHMLAYGLLTFLLLCALENPGRLIEQIPIVDWSIRLFKILLAVAAVILFGLTIELTQPFFHRQCSLQDVLANIKGAGVVAVLWVAAGLVWLVSRGLSRGRYDH